MIHQYKLKGHCIVLDVYSGAIHIVDPVAYEIIALYESTPKEDIIRQMLEKHGQMEGVDEAELRDCLADVEALKQGGKLFSKDPLRGLEGKDLPKGKPAIKALCLHVAHTCNLNCQYCFARQGNEHGDAALMSFEVGKRALDLLIRESGARRNLEVDFFGGEPLLNWQVVKDLVCYAREQEKLHNKNFRFTLTTNGILINDDVIEFSNREMSNVVLSLDGRPEVHDRLRKNFAGEGSYDIILTKFQKLVEARGGKDYYMRGTFTHHNLDFTQDIFHMADLGFRELSMEPVVCDPTDPYALTAEDLPKILEQYEILADEMLKREKEGRGFTFYHYMLDLAGGPCLPKRLVGCGSGTEYLAVTPSGELYPCHQFVSEPAFCVGNVWDGIVKKDIQKSFQSCNICENRACHDCWAKLFCAGGCAANAYHATGSIHGIYEYGCVLFKKRIECAIMMQAAGVSE